LQGAVDDTPESTYLAAARMVDEIGIAYLHIAEADWDDAPEMPMAFREALRLMYSGAMLYTGQYDRERAEAAVAAGWADLIGFDRQFIANPDLPHVAWQAMQYTFPALRPGISARVRKVISIIRQWTKGGLACRPENDSASARVLRYR
jgi:hypothetical protein